MASATASRLIRPLRTVVRSLPQQRTFFSIPGLDALDSVSLHETRILPYKSTAIYTLIADVDSYSKFIPYCTDSKVIEWSAEDADGKRWPAKADLTVGWGGYEETFTSKLLCAPHSALEALGGDAQPTIQRELLKHHSSTINAPSTANNIFTSLSTRWTIRPFHYKPPSGHPQTDKAVYPSQDQTEVNLDIKFQFSNPVYAALSKAVAPKVAAMMIEAFEKRARTLLDGPCMEGQRDTKSTTPDPGSQRMGM